MASFTQNFYHRSDNLSLYIPYMKSCHSNVQYIKKVFRNAGIGDVYRVDLIARNGGDPSQTNELSAFVYLDWYTNSVSYVWYQCILAKNPYIPANFYHFKYDTNPFKYESSYWILLKNENPRTLEQVEAEKQVALAKKAYTADAYADADAYTKADAYAADAYAAAAYAEAAAYAYAEADDHAYAAAYAALAEADSTLAESERSPPPLCTDDACSIATCVFRTQPISTGNITSTALLDDEICDLRHKVCELESTNYDLEVINYDLRFANYNLEIKLADMEKQNKNIMKCLSGNSITWSRSNASNMCV